MATKTVVEDQERAIGYRDLRFPRAAGPVAAVNL
jgi:hypothetical protein